jgi:hypothetical protein
MVSTVKSMSAAGPDQAPWRPGRTRARGSQRYVAIAIPEDRR